MALAQLSPGSRYRTSLLSPLLLASPSSLIHPLTMSPRWLTVAIFSSSGRIIINFGESSENANWRPEMVGGTDRASALYEWRLGGRCRGLLDGLRKPEMAISPDHAGPIAKLTKQPPSSLQSHFRPVSSLSDSPVLACRPAQSSALPRS